MAVFVGGHSVPFSFWRILTVKCNCNEGGTSEIQSQWWRHIVPHYQWKIYTISWIRNNCYLYWPAKALCPISWGKLLPLRLKVFFSFFLNPCLSHTGLGFWLIVEKFQDLLRIRGKFDCRISQLFVGCHLHAMTTRTHPEILLFLPFFCASLTGNESKL